MSDVFFRLLLANTKETLFGRTGRLYIDAQTRTLLPAVKKGPHNDLIQYGQNQGQKDQLHHAT